MRLALSSIKSRRPLSPSVRSTKTRKRKRHGTRSKPVHAPGEVAHSGEQNRLLTNKARGEGSLTIRLTREEIITSLINDARMGTPMVNYRKHHPQTRYLSFNLKVSQDIKINIIIRVVITTKQQFF